MRLALVLLLMLPGCAHYDAVAQPRALQMGTLQPMCVILCFATATSTDAEGGASLQSNVTSSESASVGVNK